jgi:hypothetical protein
MAATIPDHSMYVFCDRSFLQIYASVDSLADKATDLLITEGSGWVKNLVSSSEGYSKSLTKMCFFMPFIGRSMPILLEEIGKKIPLSIREREILKSDLFVEQLKDSIFNKTSLVDEWFSDFNRC